MTKQQRRRKPRTPEETAAFKGLGQAVTVIRERRGMDLATLAHKVEMTVKELEILERGERDERWGDLRLIARALEMPLAALLIEAEEFAPGPGGEKWGQKPREAEGKSTMPGAWSDTAEGGPAT